MDYGDDAMSGALAAEKIFSEFFHNVKAALRRTTARVSGQELGWAETVFLHIDYRDFSRCSSRNLVSVEDYLAA